MKSPSIANDQCSRASFLARTGMALLVTMAVANAAGETVQFPRSTKSRGNPKVKRWDVITVGNLSRNQYWGEANDKAVRKVLCTCTLIRGDGFQLLVDPSEAMLRTWPANWTAAPGSS